MFRHIVLLTLRPEAGDAARDELVAALRELPAAIEAIDEYHVYTDAGINDGNATVAVVADFADRAGYLVYRDHPAHRAVIDSLITPVLASRAAIQSEG